MGGKCAVLPERQVMATSTVPTQVTSTCLYFCHACGHRLNANEVRDALTRHESHNTVACSRCAKLGKCIRRPQEYEYQVFKAHKELVYQAAPDLKESAPVAPSSEPVLTLPVATLPSERRRTRARIAPAKRASTSELDVRMARAEATVVVSAPGHRTPVLTVVGIVTTATLAIVACVLLMGSSPKSRQSTQAPAAKSVAVSSPLATVAPVEQAPSRPNSTNVTRTPLTQPGSTAFTASAGGNAEVELASLEMPLSLYLKDKRFGEAFTRWKAFATAIPPDDEKYADWRRKATDYDHQIREGSQQLLSVLQPKAKAMAEAGQAEDLRRLFLPLNLEKLHPDDVARLRKDEPQWLELAQSKEKEATAAREAEWAKLRESFEKSLPTDDQLGTLKGRLAFGPEASPGVQLTGGAESLCNPGRKAAYFNGSRTIVLQKDNFDMIGPGNVVLQYSSTQEFSIVLEIHGQQNVSSTIHLPAGQLQTKTIAVSNKRVSEDGIKMGYRGSWEGRSYGKIRIEFKNVKPGTLALFRISY